MADENNIGASRLLGVNNLQQAVDSLTAQVNKIARSMGSASSAFLNMSGAAGRASGGSTTGNSWNANSNRMSYSSNGGGATFFGYAGAGMGGRSNGGGGVWTGLARGMSRTPPTSGGGRLAAGGAAVFSVAAGLTAYGNKYMSSNMQMDMLNNYGARMGGFGSGGYQQAYNAVNRAVFQNNYLGLSADDIARASYTNIYTSGLSPQTNGGINSAYMRYQSQVNSFGYNSPTQGAYGAATAAQETYTARSLMASRAFGFKAPIGPGGVQTPMGDIARSIMSNSLSAGKQYTPQNIGFALQQGGGLSVNLNAYGARAGWSQGTIQEYRNYITNLVQARSRGINDTQFDTLLSQASSGNKNARDKLRSAGISSTMFEAQRDLNATRLNRQSDILESLAPAFQDATDAVRNFSSALTNVLKETGLDKLIGTGAGWGSAISGGLSGFGGAFGALGGVMTAARLFGGGAGGLGGLFGGAGGATRSASGLINATRGASGAYNISSLAARGGAGLSGVELAGAGPWAAAGAAATGLGYLGWKGANADEVAHSNTFMQGMTLGVRATPFGIAGAGIRRTWDKFVTGKNKESIWSLMNPFGFEKRTTNTDGRAGGATNANSDGSGSSGGNGTTPSGGGATAAQILKFAESQLGVPYVWGGTTPGKGLDCSGLVQWAFGQAGVKLPRVSQDQAHSGSPVPVNQAGPGDLLFKGDPATHVAIAMGGGKLIEAPRTGLNVRIRGYSPSEFTSARRVVGSIGDTGSLLNNNTDKATKNTLNNQQSRVGGNIGNFSGTSEADIIASILSSSSASLPLNSGSRSASGTSGSSSLGQLPSSNGGGGGNDKASLQAYAKQLLAKYGWGDQWNAFDALVMSESSWDVKATNPSSGAYGLPQALPANKLASAGADWKTNGQTQLQWMMNYIQDRYHSPNAAWAFHQKNNWYSAGAWEIGQDQSATVHKGEMIIPAQQAESIRKVLLDNSYNPGLQKSGSGSGVGVYVANLNVTLPSGYTGGKQDATKLAREIMSALSDIERRNRLQRGQ